jgi:hypothetical protein
MTGLLPVAGHNTGAVAGSGIDGRLNLVKYSFPCRAFFELLSLSIRINYIHAIAEQNARLREIAWVQ